MAQLKKSLLVNLFGSIVDNFFKKSSMKNIANFGADLIRDRTRRGYGVKDHGRSEERLKPLAPSTIERRRRKKLSTETRPTKSNLTESGDMLDSIKGTVDAANKPKIEISGAKNRKKAAEVQDDRPFLNLSKEEVKKLEDEIKKSLINTIKRGL